MCTKADITIVIPVHNRAGIVARTLDTVAAQTVRPLRLVIVDNNSTDGTLAAVHRWVALNAVDRSLDVTVVTETIPGAAAARNRGLAEVTTPWTMFFDSDDEMLPAHVERAVRAIERAGGDVDIVGWDVSQQLADGRRCTGHFITRHMQRANLIHGIMSTQRYCVRTRLVRAVGGWDTRTRLWDDMELGTRLLATSPRVVKVNGEPTAYLNFTETSITGIRYDIGQAEITLDIIADYLHRVSLDDVLPWVTYRRVRLAADAARQGDHADAGRIMDDVTARHGLFMRMALRAVYTAQRHIGHGTHLLFRPLCPFLR